MAGLREGRFCFYCKHWSKGMHLYKPDEEWGTCDLAAGINGGPSNSRSLAFADDKEMYQADMNTNEKFSCIQFEGKG